MAGHLFLAVEAPDEGSASDTVDEFFRSSKTKLAVYPLEISHEVVGVRCAAAAGGGLDPAVEADILREFAQKDKEIANTLRAVFRYVSGPARVVGVLSEPRNMDDVLAQLWSEGFATRGRSLSEHYVGPDHDAGWAVTELGRTLKLMEGGFHQDVGFWDAEHHTSSLLALRGRVDLAPEAQWVATVKIELEGHAYASNMKTQRELKAKIEDLRRHARVMCNKYHDVPFEKCPECSSFDEKTFR